MQIASTNDHGNHSYMILILLGTHSGTLCDELINYIQKREQPIRVVLSKHLMFLISSYVHASS